MEDWVKYLVLWISAFIVSIAILLWQKPTYIFKVENGKTVLCYTYLILYSALWAVAGTGLGVGANTLIKQI